MRLSTFALAALIAWGLRVAGGLWGDSAHRIGDEIVLFNDKPIPEQLEQFLPKSTTIRTQEMYQYALNMLFAGTHNKKREISIIKKENQTNYFPDSLQFEES